MLGILCGLELEARLVCEIPNTRVAFSCVHPENAKQGAAELVRQGATRLLSFGFSGGLLPSLSSGAIVIGTSVRAAEGNWAADEKWGAALSKQFPLAACGPVAGVDTVIETSRDKRELHRWTGGYVMDMESHYIAQEADKAGIPFAILRVVVDSVDLSMPPAALVPLRANGQINLPGVLWSVATRPWQIPTLVRLGFNAQKAVKGLQEIATGLALAEK